MSAFALPVYTASHAGGFNELFEPEIRRFPRWKIPVFDRHRVCGRILPIEEAGDAEYPVAIGAGRIATEGNGELLESHLLRLKIEAFDAPEDLVLARRSSEDSGSRRHRIRRS